MHHINPDLLCVCAQVQKEMFAGVAPGDRVMLSKCVAIGGKVLIGTVISLCLWQLVYFIHSLSFPI